MTKEKQEQLRQLALEIAKLLEPETEESEPEGYQTTVGALVVRYDNDGDLMACGIVREFDSDGDANSTIGSMLTLMCGGGSVSYEICHDDRFGEKRYASIPYSLAASIPYSLAAAENWEREGKAIRITKPGDRNA